jgi:hypothetical protein
MARINERLEKLEQRVTPPGNFQQFLRHFVENVQKVYGEWSQESIDLFFAQVKTPADWHLWVETILEKVYGNEYKIDTK